MPARSIWFITASLLVIFILTFGNINPVSAQEVSAKTPSHTPTARTNTPTKTATSTTTNTPTATQAEVSATPTAEGTQTPPEQSGFSISGMVSSANGQGLAGAAVSDDQGHHAQTRADGSYALYGLASGDYQVRAVKQDLELIPYFRVVHVIDQNVNGVNFYPRPQPQPGYINTQPLPVNHKPNQPGVSQLSANDLDSQSAYKPGKPGTAYAPDPSRQTGVIGVPYAFEAPGAITHLNAPTALTLDGAGHLWEAEEHGNRLVGIDNSTLLPFQEIGDKPGISYMDDYVYNSLTAAAIQPGSGFLWVGDTTRLVKYDPTLAYPDQYKLEFPAENPWERGTDTGHFSEIRGIAFNTSGSEMYVSDRFNQRVQVFDVSGADPVYLRSLGVDGAAGSDGFHLNQPWHITYYEGSLYVADSQNHRIQKCPLGDAPCSTVAGTGAAGFETNQLNTPTAVAVTAGRMYITDSYNQRVIRCDFSGSATTNCQVFAGMTGEAGSDAAHLRWPADVAVDGDQVFVADRDNQRILEFTDSGAPPLSPAQQLGVTGVPYAPDATHLNRPWGIAVDLRDSSLYVSENWGYSLAKFNSSGALVWRVPDNPGNYGSDQHHFGNFSGGNQGNLAVAADHRIYVPDPANHRVMVYLPDGTLSNLIPPDQGGQTGQLTCPAGVAVSSNSIYVVEPCSQRVQVFDLSFNYVTTIGQSGVAGQDSSHFSNPVSVALDRNADSILVVDQGNQRVQRCKVTGNRDSFSCVPFAGITGVNGGRSFRYLNQPLSVAVDYVNQRVLVSEEETSRVQVFDMDGGYLTTISGEWGDEGGRVRSPAGLAVDIHGVVYVADRENARVLHFNPGVPDWQPVSLNGFGDQSNGRIGGLTYATVLYENVPTPLVYATTANTGGSPFSPQVWRLPDNIWQAVSDPGFGDPHNSQLTGITSYADDLYAGTYNATGAQLWRCHNLATNLCQKQSDWEKIPPPPGWDGHNITVSRMVTFHSLLFVSFTNWYDAGSGPTTDGGEVWNFDGANWNGPLLKLDAATTKGQAVATIQAMAVDGDVLYAGTSDPLLKSSAQLWRCTWSTSGAKWEKVKDGGITDPQNFSISSLAMFAGKLYVGTSNSSRGGMIYRYDSSLSTDEVVSDSISPGNNHAVRAMVAGPDKIYALLSNDAGGLQIFSSPSGDANAWTRISNDYSFGSGIDASVYQDSAAAISPDGQLTFGTWNEINGGAVWLYSPANLYHISGFIQNLIGGMHDVELTLQPGGQTARSLDNGNGAFRFDNLSPGTYVISVPPASTNYLPRSQQFTITNASVENVLFTSPVVTIQLEKPSDGKEFTSLDPLEMGWTCPYHPGTHFNVQISTNRSFTALVKNITMYCGAYTFKNPLTNKTYYWRVRRAFEAPQPWSQVYVFKTPAVPAAPQQLLPANGASLPAAMLSPNFTWKAAALSSKLLPVQYYQIQVSRQDTFYALDMDETTLNAATFFIPPSVVLKPNQVYYWRLRAFTRQGYSSLWSSVRTFKILPAAPVNGIAYDTNTLLPGFHWGDPYCTGKYLLQVFRGASPTHPLIQSATITTGTACEGDFKLTTSLQLNTLYEWRVTTLGATGNSTPLIHTFTTPAALPGVPVLLGPASNEAIPDAAYPTWQPTFSWQAVTAGAVAYYQIQLASQVDFGSSAFVDEKINAPDTTYPLASRPKYNTSIYWRVRACDSYDYCGKWSEARKLFTRPGTPYNLKWHGDTYDTVIEWSDPGNNPANSYALVFYNDQPYCTTPWKTATSVTTSTHVVLNSDDVFCVKVQGVGPSANITGDFSAMLEFGPPVPPPAPELLTPADKALISATTLSYKPYQVFFSWNPSPGADDYDLELSTTADFSQLIDFDYDSTLTSVTLNLGPGKYYWRVRGIAGGQWFSEVWSPVRSFTTMSNIGFMVTVDTGSPTQGAQITVSGANSQQIKVLSGGYTFINVPSGTYTITVSKINCITQTRNLQVTDSRNYRESFNLASVVSTPGVLRIQLTWNPNTGANLQGSLWLPPSTPMHIIYPNVGKTDLDVFPHALEMMEQFRIGDDVFDVKPPGNGKYVFGANLLNPDNASWKGAEAKVVVYSGATLIKSCAQPAGSAGWWYAFDLTMSGGKASVTCKNSMQASSPGPYKDNPISGFVVDKNNYHPVAFQKIDYDTGWVSTDPNGAFTIPGVVSGSFTLTPDTYNSTRSFTPANITVQAGDTNVDFLAGIPAVFYPGKMDTVAIRGDYAFLGIGGWLSIVDIHNKSAPQEISRVYIDDNQIRDIVLSGNYAYLAVYGSEVNVVDLQVLTKPRWVSVAPVNAMALAMYGKYLVMVSEQRYVRIYQPGDSSGSTIRHLVTLDLGADTVAYDVAVNGHYAYILSEQGLFIYDISDPAHPVGPWRFGTIDYYGLVVDGQYAFLSNAILDVSDPAHIHEVDYAGTLGGRPKAKNGKYLYVTGSYEWTVVDVSDPAFPVQHGSATTSGWVSDLEVQDNYVFIVSGPNYNDNVLHIWDVSDQNAPVEVAGYQPAP